MENPLLSAALIVKNEEANLPACLDALAALRPLLAEICIYDTGSTDGTVQLAQDRGAVVERGYWDGDFSRAKNAAIAMTRGKWVLVVDADEVVRADVSALQAHLRDALTWRMVGRDALQVQLNDIRAGGRHEQSWTARRLLRPNRAKFANAVHEDVVSLRAGAELDETALSASVICIDHLGYADAGAVRGKTARNLAIANASIIALESDPSRSEELIRALVDRARSARGHGQDEQAFSDLRRVRGMRSGCTYRTWGMEMLVDLLTDHHLDGEATSVIDQLRAEGVAAPAMCDWLTARLDLHMGRIERGMELLRQIDVITSSSGVVVGPHLLLEARKEAGIHLGIYDEAAVCLIRLMASYGRMGDRSAEMLLKLWGTLPREVLVEMLIEADRGYLDDVIAEFDAFADGVPLAAELRKQHAHKRTPVS